MSAIPLCPTLNLGLDFLTWRESLEANSSPLAGHNEGKTFMNSPSKFDDPKTSLDSCQLEFTFFKRGTPADIYSFLKFIYSEKAIKFCEISTVDSTVTT